MNAGARRWLPGKVADRAAFASNGAMERRRKSPPPVSTLGQLRRHVCWIWARCANPKCGHRRPMALTPLIIRWIAEGSSDLLRRHTRCTRCGRRGATLQHPSWIDIATGWAPFPDRL
jgi:hypothetical protein